MSANSIFRRPNVSFRTSTYQPRCSRCGETTLPAADVLSPFLRNVLRLFAQLEEGRAFYFGGGMALAAYHLQHRVSEDIDLYCLVRRGHFTMAQVVALAKEKDPGLDEYYLAIAFERAVGLPDRAEDMPLTLLHDLDMADLKAFFREEAVNLLGRGLDCE